MIKTEKYITTHSKTYFNWITINSTNLEKKTKKQYKFNFNNKALDIVRALFPIHSIHNKTYAQATHSPATTTVLI